MFPLFFFLSSYFQGNAFSVLSWHATLFPIFSVLSQQKQLPTLHGFSLPQFTSPCRVPAEFCGSGCADYCVNPQIHFLGVQDGLVLIWLYFMDARHTKSFHAVPPSWLLPWKEYILEKYMNQELWMDVLGMEKRKESDLIIEKKHSAFQH